MTSTKLPVLGQVITHKRTFVQQNFNTFAELSHDDNPIHVDPAFAATTRFGRTVSHGMMLYGMICGVLSSNFPEARQLEQELVFPKPTFAGDEMTIRLEVTEVLAASKQARLTTTITRPDGENSCEGHMVIQWKSENE
jgi:3-hydroxybutyryl-CoA dehydratase